MILCLRLKRFNSQCIWKLLSGQVTVRVTSPPWWQTQGPLSEIFDFPTWFSTRSLSPEHTLSFWVWAQCLCTALPTSLVRPARENTRRDTRTKFRDAGSQSESPTDHQHKHNVACGFVGEVVRGWGCSDNMTRMQHSCTSVNSRHYNICSEVPASTMIWFCCGMFHTSP